VDAQVAREQKASNQEYQCILRELAKVKTARNILEALGCFPADRTSSTPSSPNVEPPNDVDALLAGRCLSSSGFTIGSASLHLLAQ
jgi:hypothetical protein